jgi:small subunit ribosomal protein S20
MPNIHQQKRRVKIAARQRTENLRYRSAAKTVYKRLEAAVADGDKERAAAEHRELVRLLDRAASSRAIHPNKAARKKAQAASLVADQS